MKAKLISRELGELVIDEEATIGRGTGNTVTVKSSVVSSEHARIAFDAERGAYVLEDLGSLNGTELDGVRIERKEVLGKLHVIRFGGGDEFVFQLLSAADSSEDSHLETIGIPTLKETQVDAEVPELPAALREGASGAAGAKAGDSEDAGGTRIEKDVVPVPEVLARASEGVGSKDSVGTAFTLEVAGKDRSRRFLLKSGENLVGRSKDADIRLDLADLSRRHATLIVSGDAVAVRDEGSRNHTFVDGEQVEGEAAVPVGAQLVFGRLEARLVATPTEPDTEIDDSGA